METELQDQGHLFANWPDSDKKMTEEEAQAFMKFNNDDALFEEVEPLPLPTESWSDLPNQHH